MRFPSRCSSRLNQDVKDLIWRLICVDVKARMHVSMLHLHQWMRSKPTQDRSNCKTFHSSLIGQNRCRLNNQKSVFHKLWYYFFQILTLIEAQVAFGAIQNSNRGWSGVVIPTSRARKMTEISPNHLTRSLDIPYIHIFARNQ